MYRISVPVDNSMLKTSGRDRIAEEVEKMEAERVFLSMECYAIDKQKQEKAFSELADNAAYFHKKGYEVGAWICAFMFREPNSYQHMVTLGGSSAGACPTDENFIAFAADYLKQIARSGVDLIMFDDDFRLGWLGNGPACFCPNHLAAINRITGETHTREELQELVFAGGKNRYRDAWLQANGDSMRHFSERMRQAVDEVNPAVRLGFCACMSSWDVDGNDAGELTRILAGNTKPFLRLNGAPYWAKCRSRGNSLQDLVELERMESSWTRDGEIELMAEGDVNPRPRQTTPANYLEGFDTAMRAAGCTDGILKYAIDYYANADYETGYVKRHVRNLPLYREIDRYFGGKRHVGVRVWESMKKVADFVVPTVANPETDPEFLLFSGGARTLAHNTVPTTYEGTGVTGILFDEAARHVGEEAFSKGLILDIAAAEILTERGYDVGIAKFGKSVPSGSFERFVHDNNHILTWNAPMCEITLREGAEVLSDSETSVGTLPVSYRYENAKGQRFLVINMQSRYTSEPASTVFKHYARSRQYAEMAEWLGGEKLPAYVYGNPALYIQCKEGDGALAVGLWNFWPDDVLDPVVELAKPYSQIEFIHCTGRLDGDRVYLSDIAPFGFAGFEVK